MKSKLLVLVFALVLSLTLSVLAAAPGAAAPFTGPCPSGGAYDPACDVDHDGAVTILDIQLTAGHWNQTGTWLSDNSHTHLGQTWTGTNTPLSLTGAYGAPDNAPLLLSNPNGHGLRITSAGVGGVAIDSVGEYGVYVDSADFYGIFVNATGSHGVVVNSAGGDGVYAISESATHFGGFFRNRTAGGGGVRAEGGSNTSPDLVLGGFGAEDDGRIYSEPSLSGSDILLYSNDAVQIDLDEDNNSASAFTVRNGTNATVWTVSEAGLVAAAGPSAVQVDAGSQGKRLAYAVTSPQNWIEDFGSGQLQDGQAVIALETAYAEIINAGLPYHVFLTPLGDCALFVAEKTVTSVTVKALGGQKCTIAFDYRIVALRRGYETERMEQFVDRGDE